MKRNISINISGIIFHVEEDGYDLLRSYLDSITRYFSHYDDSKEITDDIESRIAEIFLKKLTSSKQVITKDDVETVVSTMGSVEDFAAQDYGEEEAFAFAGSKTQSSSTTFQEEPEERRKLYRDTQRKILGGVAAGIAYYFKTDPLWVRLLLIVFMFADAFITFGVLDTITFITYIVFWIVVPGRPDLEQNEKIKKLFRNPDDQVLGGVAGGLASYFGTDPTVLRLLFVLTIFFGGAGLVIYVVLWIITPLAKTITDRMQMKGEPVTLTNIETSIKKNFSVSKGGEESTLLKAVLFPFRLVAVIFANIGRALGPFMVFLGDAARVIFGLFLIFIGGAFLLSLIATTGVTLGLATIEPYGIGVNIPIEVIQNSFSQASIVFLLGALLLPALGLVISGIAIIARRRLVNTAVIWTAVGIWFVCLLGLAATVPPVAMDFQDEARYTDEESINIAGGTPVFQLDGYPEYDDPKVNLTIVGYDGDEYELQKNFRARGSSRKKALEHAQMVTYSVQVEDSVVSFPSVYSFSDGAKYRGQELDMTLRIPYDQPFQMERNLTEILRNTLYRDGFRDYDLPGNTFIFTDQGLNCTSCENENEETEVDTDTLEISSNDDGGESYRLGLRDFNSLEIRGPFRAQINPSEEYSVDVTPNELPLNRLKADVEDGRLIIYYDGKYSQQNDQVYDLVINMPVLEQIWLRGEADVTVSEFNNSAFDIDLSGSARLNAVIRAESVKVNMTGDTQTELSGNAQNFEIEVSGSSVLDAAQFQANEATISSRAASEAQLMVTNQLNANITGAGRVEYQGDPEVQINEGGKSKLRKIEVTDP